MSFEAPTLADLITRTSSDFRTRLGIAGSLLRRFMARTLAEVWSGTVYQTHQHLTWLGRQIFPHLSEDEFLIVQAALYGITKNPATFATGLYRFTGVDTTTIATGTVVVLDDGSKYTTTAGGDIGDVTTLLLDLPVTADVAGLAGNLEVGEVMNLETPITDIDSAGAVQGDGTLGLIGGLDEETTEELRTRLLERWRTPPKGGSDEDYISWAKEITGTTRVWVHRHESGLGTLTVRWVQDNDIVSIIPDAGEVTAMQTKLDSERPITAEVTAAAPTLSATAFTIAITPDTTAVRAAVSAELDDLMLQDGETGDGVARGTIKLSRMQTFIGNADGVTDYTLTVPPADFVPTLGQLPTLGVVTWV